MRYIFDTKRAQRKPIVGLTVKVLKLVRDMREVNFWHRHWVKVEFKELKLEPEPEHRA